MTNDAQTVDPVAELLAPASGAAPAADECREALARVTAERDEALAAYMATPEVSLTNDAYNKLMRRLVTLTYEKGVYRSRALALVRQVQTWRSTAHLTAELDESRVVALAGQLAAARAKLALIQEMAAEDLRTGRFVTGSSLWQIEADARAALAGADTLGGGAGIDA